MMLRVLAPSIAALAVVSSADAAPAPGWAVVADASSLTFDGSVSGQGFRGRFARWTARIAFDPRNLAASRVVAVIDTASARTGDRTRDEALPTDDWFSAKAFPTATFTSTSITATGPNRYVAKGRLSIRGVTRPVSLPFALTIAGDIAKMHGTLTLDRASFGLGQGQWKTADTVALPVKVTVQITARRQQRSPA